MSHPPDRFQILQVAQADHVLLSLSIWNFRRLFTGARPPEAAQQFAEIQQFITKKIFAHFADEESRVFPLMLADDPGKPTSKVIAELRAEHATLLTKAHRLNALLARCSLNKCKGEHWSALRSFLTDMEKHVAKEDQLFALFT